MVERYLSIAREIRNGIADGTYPVGSALPGRLALVKTYQSTRGTIDRTIRFLAEQNVVESRHGAGTYVLSTLPKIMVVVVGLTSGFPQVDGIQFSGIDRETAQRKSERDKLSQFDAIFWYLPAAEVRQWVNEFPDTLVQIIINRDYPECNFVTTDHAGAYAEITMERLQKHPHGVPVFIRSSSEHYVIDKRLEGFSNACREQKKSFKVIVQDGDFEASLKALDTLRDLLGNGPLLLFAASVQLVGPVMAWVRQMGLVWSKDVFYSDIDNELQQHVFGVKITTYIQDYGELMRLAAQELQRYLAKEIDSIQLLVMPKRVNGDT